MKGIFSKLFFLVFAIHFVGIYSASAADLSSLLVAVHQGTLQGRVNEDTVCAWLNIPYAKAPIGDMRFRAPQAADSWQGVRDATKMGHVAPQFRRSMRNPDKQNEDCLQLNVWSPSADGKKRPVMVWIHGGGFLVGSGTTPMYNGSKLAKNGDVVVVTINYRLGPFGFLYLDQIKGKQAGFDDNLGIRDQVAALQWVHDNIAAFGGDPDAVTIFGESAGGVSVLTLLAVPSAHGLFKRAIVESGPPEALFKPEMGTTFTERYLKVLGVSPDHLEQLRTLPADTLEQAMYILIQALMHESTTVKIPGPVIDGTFLPEDPITAIREGKAAGIDLMIGTNKDEATLLSLKRVGLTPRNAEELAPYLANIAPEPRRKIVATYRHYPNKKTIMEMTTDGIFNMPAIRVGELQSAFAPTYMYRFDWSSGAMNMVGLRACHGAELPFVFGTIDKSPGKYFALFSNKKKDWKLSHQVEQCWANFARYGNPDPSGAMNWGKYNSTARTTMIFDNTIHVASDPRSEQRIAWTGQSIFK